MKLDEESKKYLRTYYLVTHGDRRNKESFFHVTLMADFLLKCLKMANYFGVFQPIESNFSGDGDSTWMGWDPISYWQTRRQFPFQSCWPMNLPLRAFPCLAGLKRRPIGRSKHGRLVDAVLGNSLLFIFLTQSAVFSPDYRTPFRAREMDRFVVTPTYSVAPVQCAWSFRIANGTARLYGSS